MKWINNYNVSGINDDKFIPDEFSLSNYPNPFNPTTTIVFELAKSGNVHLTVYDITGKEITTLIDGNIQRGSHEVIFDASNLATGIYFYQLKMGNFVKSKKMLLVK